MDTYLGIEFGSTRIKAVAIGDKIGRASCRERVSASV